MTRVACAPTSPQEKQENPTGSPWGPARSTGSTQCATRRLHAAPAWHPHSVPGFQGLPVAQGAPVRHFSTMPRSVGLRGQVTFCYPFVGDGILTPAFQTSCSFLGRHLNSDGAGPPLPAQHSPPSRAAAGLAAGGGSAPPHPSALAPFLGQVSPPRKALFTLTTRSLRPENQPMQLLSLSQGQDTRVGHTRHPPHSLQGRWGN